jgi:sugar phosphate isomerase/epimerase
MDARTGFVTQEGMETDDPLAAADRLGFDYVELLMDGRHHRTRLAERRGTLERGLERRGLGLVVHLPFPLDVGSPHEHARRGAVAELEACLGTAGDLGAEKAVVHPTASAWSQAWDHEAVRPNVVASIRALDEHAADRGVELCAENVFGSAYTVETIDGLLRETDVSMTLDTGHARVTGWTDAETAGFVAEHADRVSHVHLNDTRAARDEHLLFGSGTVDFGTVLGAFPAAWDGTLSLEVHTDSIDDVAVSKERLDALLGR